MVDYGSVHPKYQAVYNGSTVNITCFSATIPTWTKDFMLLPLQLKVLNSIILHNVGEHDNGKYNCHGKYQNDSSFKATSDLLVGGKNSNIFIDIRRMMLCRVCCFSSK